MFHLSDPLEPGILSAVLLAASLTDQPDVEETVFLVEGTEQYEHVCVGVAQGSQPKQNC